MDAQRPRCDATDILPRIGPAVTGIVDAAGAGLVQGQLYGCREVADVDHADAHPAATGKQHPAPLQPLEVLEDAAIPRTVDDGRPDDDDPCPPLEDAEPALPFELAGAVRAYGTRIVLLADVRERCAVEPRRRPAGGQAAAVQEDCLLYTSDAADEFR
ncbi:MAG: hypothetical protein QUU85_02505, partial [Candidatus Eisenbacteria bacterium]|nr:hypothetical protein [Candidatus Eisenbacteria bacterium]